MDLHDGTGTQARFHDYAADLASVLGHADRVRPFKLIPTNPELDFIEKCAGSAADEAVKDWFVTEHLIGTLEGEPESSEVTERAPTAPHVGPIEQLEAV